jgi:hypothetical protein
MLAGVFGYDKYSEVTSEFAIRGTYCDLAIKIDGALKTLIEALPPSVAFGQDIVTQLSAPLLGLPLTHKSLRLGDFFFGGVLGVMSEHTTDMTTRRSRQRWLDYRH